MPREGDEASQVDALLVAVHELTLAGTPPASATKDLPVDVSPPAPATPRPPLPDAPRRPVELRDTSGTRSAPGRRGIAAFAALDGQLWQGAIPAGLGPRAGVRLGLWPHGWVAVVGGTAWGLATARGLRAQTIDASSILGLDLVPSLQLGAGAELKVLMTSSGDSSPPAGQTASAGAIVSARVHAPLGLVELSAEPRLEILMRPMVVEGDSHEVFRIPNLVASLSLSGELGLLPER